jgi:hypothetical protein
VHFLKTLNGAHGSDKSLSLCDLFVLRDKSSQLARLMQRFSVTASIEGRASVHAGIFNTSIMPLGLPVIFSRPSLNVTTDL